MPHPSAPSHVSPYDYHNHASLYSNGLSHHDSEDLHAHIVRGNGTQHPGTSYAATFGSDKDVIHGSESAVDARVVDDDDNHSNGSSSHPDVNPTFSLDLDAIEVEAGLHAAAAVRMPPTTLHTPINVHSSSPLVSQPTPQYEAVTPSVPAFLSSPSFTPSTVSSNHTPAAPFLSVDSYRGVGVGAGAGGGGSVGASVLSSMTPFSVGKLASNSATPASSLLFLQRPSLLQQHAAASPLSTWLGKRLSLRTIYVSIS